MLFVCSIEVQVVGKRLNHGGGYGLETPVISRFYDQEILVNCLIKKIETVKKELECKVTLKTIQFCHFFDSSF